MSSPPRRSASSLAHGLNPIAPAKPHGSIEVGNHQQTQPIDTRLLRRIVRTLVLEILGRPVADLAVQIVGLPEIVRLNETFLRHAGPTDVITFDYREGLTEALSVRGEMFVCLPVAIEQSRRFRTPWEEELVRYIVHGTLHLCGHDDCEETARRKMKRAEDQVLRRLRRRFHFGKLGGPRRAAAASVR